MDDIMDDVVPKSGKTLYIVIGVVVALAIIAIVIAVIVVKNKKKDDVTTPPVGGTTPAVITTTPKVPGSVEKGIWKCLMERNQNLSLPVRVDPATGLVQCMSKDGANCMWGADASICQNHLLNANNDDVKPASCPPVTASDPGWCGQALAMFTN